ncbi:hypothetical protein PROFUN_09467 [Planoprotostelium fungivorum]|uniref:PH domain-containing protein n=1 Tax=Planoprotostelium fungivorum TaxID=1890364 RepID=A0A2P6NH26_9EUKA|nr:hypothetical protein PROFUN_10139 [Planoprotostelium fungivorum]PRP83255.1 hypothetical protein PROFUN_09467 [Planoprotostelium fungivorum]
MDGEKLYIKEGWLWKQGGWYKSWKRRYFRLDNRGCLSYHPDEESAALGSIDISSMISLTQLNEGSDEGDGEPTINFSLEMPGRTWFFRAVGEQTVQEWFQAIQISQLYDIETPQDLETLDTQLTEYLCQKRNTEYETIDRRRMLTETLIAWMNSELSRLSLGGRVQDLSQLSDGILLNQMVEAYSGNNPTEITRGNSTKEKITRLNRINQCLQDKGKSTECISIQGFLSGNMKLVMDTLWMMFFTYLLSPLEYRGHQGIQALCQWYRDKLPSDTPCDVSLTSSFIDGHGLQNLTRSSGDPDPPINMSLRDKMSLFLKKGREAGIPDLLNPNDLTPTKADVYSIIIYLSTAFVVLNE